MSLIVLLGVGIVIVILLWAAGRRRGSEFDASNGNPGEDLGYRLQLPRADLIRRCFSTNDLAFAAKLRSPAILQLLLRERRRLALEWLRLTRRIATRLFRLHVHTVRHAADLRPTAEAKLAAQVCVFLMACQLMSVMVRLYGPFRTQTSLRSVQSLANVLAALSGRIAETVGSGAASGVHAAG